MSASGYEPDLLRNQYHFSISIFACNAFKVYSSELVSLSPPGSPCPMTTTVLNMSGVDQRGSRDIPGQTTNSWLNTGSFLAAWSAIIETPFDVYDFTVKVDPDAVFFTERLRRFLRGPAAAGGAFYVLNCDMYTPSHADMFGAVEVFSRQAVEAFREGKSRCEVELPWQGWGEDYFMAHCLDMLGVGTLEDFSLLMDYNGHCNKAPPASCSSGEYAAFHPFKAVGPYLQCVVDAVTAEQARASASRRLRLAGASSAEVGRP